MKKYSVLAILAMLFVSQISFANKLVWEAPEGIPEEVLINYTYRVYMKTGEGEFTVFRENTWLEKTVNLDGLTPGLKYYFYVVSVYRNVESDPSNQVDYYPDITTPTVANPFAPSTISVKVNSAFSIKGSGTGWAQTTNWRVVSGVGISLTSDGNNAIILVTGKGPKRIEYKRTNPLGSSSALLLVNGI